MKRTFSILMVSVLLATPAFAHPLDKVTGGVKDIVTSPLEVSSSIKTETDKKQFMPFALVGGALKGGFYMGKKMVTGTYHIVSSPLDMVRK